MTRQTVKTAVVVESNSTPEPEEIEQPEVVTVNPLDGFKHVSVGGYIRQLTDARVINNEIVQVPNGKFDVFGNTWLPMRRVAGTTNQYDLYLEDEAMVVRVERGNTLQRSYKGEIHNDLAQLVIKLTHVEKRAGMKAQLKIALNEAEQTEYEATQTAYLEREWDVIVAAVVAACIEPCFYDDRAEEQAKDHPFALPLTHTLSEPAIRQIRDFLDTELSRIQLYFR